MNTRHQSVAQALPVRPRMPSDDSTVAVLCYNEARHITACMESLLSQSRPPREILVVDNGSTDGTQAIVRRYEAAHPNIRLIVNPVRSISKSRNIALWETRTACISFTDADCIVPPDTIDSLSGRYRQLSQTPLALAGVGGSNRPPQTTVWFKLLTLLMDSYPGTGSSIQGRWYTVTHQVPHIPCVNVMFDTEALRAVGGFDETLGSIIEDEDISYRLRQAGYSLWYVPNSGVVHLTADSLPGWIGKMIIYGSGRISFVIRHPETFGLKAMTPFAVFALIAGSVAWAPVKLALAAYLAVLGVFAVDVAIRYRRPLYIPLLIPLYVITHLCYGIGELIGTARYVVWPVPLPDYGAMRRRAAASRGQVPVEAGRQQL